MTPLHLRRRLRSALTILAGDDPDLTAHANAWQEAAYAQSRRAQELEKAHADTLSAHYRVVGELDGIRAGLCTDGDTRDALRHISAVLDDAGVSIPNCDRGQGCTSYHLTHRIHTLADERDAAAALISTVRAQNQGYAAELAEVDQILGRALGYPAMGPEIGGDLPTVCTGEHTPASLAAEAASRIMVLEARERGEKAPKRKRTKEERWEQRKRSLDGQWTCSDPVHPVAAVREAVTALGRDFHTSRTIAEMARTEPWWTDLARDEVQRLVPELARAGYLTVAKGPGGVRVYSLKEGA